MAGKYFKDSSVVFFINKLILQSLFIRVVKIFKFHLENDVCRW